MPLFTTRTPQKAKNSSSGKMVTSQPRGASSITLRTLTRNLMKPPDSPLRAPGLHISILTDDDPSDFLDDLAAAVQGITI